MQIYIKNGAGICRFKVKKGIFQKILSGLLTAVVFEITFSAQTFIQTKRNLLSVFFACRQMEVKMTSKTIVVKDKDVRIITGATGATIQSRF
ncbi:hypothetical protein B7990_09220 [Fibrobacter sp. UWB4]|nr:hypothetical protein B7990_09220 [Fibrobacter sp. UWB4]